MVKQSNRKTPPTIKAAGRFNRRQGRKPKRQGGLSEKESNHGDRYFLAQAWTAADSIGMEAPKSHTERATDLASNTRKIETEPSRAIADE